MPIASCITLEHLDAEAVAEKWAALVPFAESEMTVATSTVTSVGGRVYSAIAELHLPSMWSSDQIERLQEGLAQALAEVLEIEDSRILVITRIVESGRVVEEGSTLRW